MEDFKEIDRITFNFERCIKDNRIYVDKTAYIHRMVTSSEYFIFCSRPRRFGKSLMCSTLAYLFRGRRDLFEGLYISKTDYDFKAYTVIHLDFSGLSTVNYDDFLADFRDQLARAAAGNGLEIQPDRPQAMLNQILSLSKTPVVLIIDEYDTPLTSLAGNERKIELAENIRECLSSFFRTVKMNTHRFRFFFITGILRLSNMSIFSEMNNLVDISMDERYATAFGYTQEELEEYFVHYIDRFMSSSDNPYRNRQDFLDAVKDYYDGYCFSFSEKMSASGDEAGERRPHYSTISAGYTRTNLVPTVYNPVAVGTFFSRGCSFEPYWNYTDRSGLAVRLASKHNLASLGLDYIRVGKMSLTNFKIEEVMQENVSPVKIYTLLYYTGYLTIEDGDSSFLILRFPNQETAISFSEGLCELCLEDYTLYCSIGQRIVRAVGRGDSEALVGTLRETFHSMPYDYLKDAKEAQYKSNLHMVLKTSGISDLRCEEHGPFGRADNVLIHRGNVYCIEAKFEEEADKALLQAMERGYHLHHLEQMEKGGRKIHLLGLSFSSKERNISAWSEAVVLDASHFVFVHGEREGEEVEVVPVPAPDK